MSKKKDRTGEENINKFGSKMIIKEYRGANDLDIYFPEYNWISEHNAYNNFKKGLVKCPYEPNVFERGYIGDGIYKSRINGKLIKSYSEWHDMFDRCYNSEFHKRHPSYKDCDVANIWFNYQRFGDWFSKNYYEVPGETMHLDKDILYKGNKIYSPEKCIFVPNKINTLFIKCDRSRGDLPIGVYYDKDRNKYTAGYKINKIRKFIGRYDNPEDAFYVYKLHKEKLIKEVIDSYKGIIPEPHYSRLREAMYNYNVEIDD